MAVDDLSSYVRAFQETFRSKLPREGRGGRAKLWPWPQVAIVQVIKRRTPDGWSLQRRLVQGTMSLVAGLISQTQGRGTLNTAYIERLNGTFRQRLACLARRTCSLAAQPETIQLGMDVVGCLYNFCTYHDSLRFLSGWQRPALVAPDPSHCCWFDRPLLDYGRVVQLSGPAAPLDPALATRSAFQADLGPHR